MAAANTRSGILITPLGKWAAVSSCYATESAATNIHYGFDLWQAFRDVSRDYDSFLFSTLPPVSTRKERQIEICSKINFYSDFIYTASVTVKLASMCSTA